MSGAYRFPILTQVPGLPPSPVIWLYRILFPPALLILLPAYLRRMWRRGGYTRSLKHRFGFLPALPPPEPGKPRLWVQAVSVGELQAVEPLLTRLAREEGFEIALTTTTSTGYALARERLAHLCRCVGYFPLDFLPCSALAWRRLGPDAVLQMEGELWPEHLHQARRRGRPAWLINARLSNRSFRRYHAARPLARWLLGHLARILAASEPDAERFRALAPRPERVSMAGNLKFDAPVGPLLPPEARAELVGEFGFTGAGNGRSAPVLLGCSTWPGEEAMLLEALEAAEAAGLKPNLLLIPRHAERREELAGLLRRQPRPWHQRTRGTQAPHGTRIYLADTTGEMRRLIQVASVAFVGKSLPPHEGGQTPIECAAFGLPMVYGPRMSNFRQACRELEAAGGARRVETRAEAIKALLELLRDREQAAATGRNAQAWHRGCQGVCERLAAACSQNLRHHQSKRAGNP